MDLSGVELHTEDESAAAIDARAYAIGDSIHVGVGELGADSEHLLAHEVAHTVQQRGAVVQRKAIASTPGDAHEVEADRAADAMVAGRPFTVRASGTAGAIP